MTRAEAIAGARALQDEADQGWPEGYDPARVRVQATRYLRVLDAAARTPAAARALVEQLETVELAW
jgi:hypothetical protein